MTKAVLRDAISSICETLNALHNCLTTGAFALTYYYVHIVNYCKRWAWS